MDEWDDVIEKGTGVEYWTVEAQISVDRVSLPPLAISLSEYVYNQQIHI